VSGYLGDLADDATIKTTSSRIVAFYQSVVADPAVFRDGSNCRPHFSLRTLCRSLLHVRQACSAYGLVRALYDGIAMNFLTLLDPASSKMMSALIVKHLEIRSNDASQAIFTRPSQPPGSHVPILEFWCPQGPLPPHQPEDYILVPSVKDSMRGVLRSVVATKFPVLLQGPTSSGKTSMVEYLVRSFAMQADSTFLSFDFPLTSENIFST
jgi:midasin